MEILENFLSNFNKEIFEILNREKIRANHVDCLGRQIIRRFKGF